MPDGVLTASTTRRDAIEAWFATLRPGMTVALSTHINSDGDGCGSETALARLLAQRGIHARIVNPTPWPAMFNFLLGDDIDEASARGAAGAMERFDITSEELDGIVEHPRSITGTRMAMFFRDLGHGKVKVSFRSTGSVDVQQFARRYGGGGHAKASGALLTGHLAEVQEQVVADARAYLTGADNAAA